MAQAPEKLSPVAVPGRGPSGRVVVGLTTAILAGIIGVSLLGGSGDGSPTAAASSTPLPVATPFVDPRLPLPGGWDALVLTSLPEPWSLGDSAGTNPASIEVLRSGSRVGAVVLTVYPPEAWPDYDLRGGGLATVRQQLARDWLGGWVAGAPHGLRAEPEPIRDVPVAGGTGVWTAVRVVEKASGETVARYVGVWFWDGRALWLVETSRSLYSDGIHPPAFDVVADQQAFDPALEALSGGLRLPTVLPTPIGLDP